MDSTMEWRGNPLPLPPPVIAHASSTPEIIDYYSFTYQLPDTLLLRIAKAESGLSATATNPHSTASGVFQWIKGSWDHFCRPLGFEDVFNPDQNTHCAAIVIKDGGLSNWNASRPVWQVN